MAKAAVMERVPDPILSRMLEIVHQNQAGISPVDLVQELSKSDKVDRRLAEEALCVLLDSGKVRPNASMDIVAR